MRITLASAALLTVIVACGASDFGQGDGSAGGTSGSVPPGPSSSSSTNPPSDGGLPPPAPPIPRDFPLTTPSVGGYELADVWAGANLVYVPSAAVWSKSKGAPFVLERMGQIVRVEANARKELLDFADEVHMAGEGGALGMALHPQFGDGTGPKPYVYVWYNAVGDKQRLARFTWNAASQTFDRASESILLEQAETTNEHNGARIAFGPDGFLYFGNGDDLNSANHQTITRALFAGIFRIDVDSVGGAVSHAPLRNPEGGTAQSYFIPNDNPFVGVPNAVEEYWALGLRNPFALSFDRGSGALWMGDVGETFREEVNLIVKGGNYQWPYREGELVVGTTPTTIGTPQAPKYTYTHSSMADLTAVFGGFVYRGKELPELTGKYIYTDYVSERVWALDISTATAKRTTLVDNHFGRQPLGVAEDEDGEIYVLELGGMTKLARDTSKDLIPKTLSETKLYKDLAAHTLAADFVPYELNSPLWSDAAAKKRFISVPAGKQVALGDDGNLVFPVGTRFVKEFDLPAAVNPKNRTRNLETRVLVVASDTTYGLTYRWNAAGTDGTFVTEPTDEAIEDLAAAQTRTWHYPNFGECWSCHRADNRVLGFTARQLNLVRSDGKSQLEVLAAAGVFEAAKVSTFPAGLAKPSDTSADLEARATAYIAANCSSCHRKGNSFLGDGETWNALPGVPLAERGLINAPNHNYPMARAFGLGNAPLIAPGNPAGSILLARVKSTDEKLRMPPLGRNLVDPSGALLLEQWISSMPP
ncbi:MAG: hypothetical protein JWP87_4588 [Labilithrix sp.]|nr:hypothetical protein [Labilithrix sp.]